MRSRTGCTHYATVICSRSMCQRFFFATCPPTVFIRRCFEAISLVHCSSPCKDQKVVKDEGKTGTSEEAKRKTTLELEEELAKKYAAGVVSKKAAKAAAKKSSC